MPFTAQLPSNPSGLLDPHAAGVVAENIQKSLARFREDRQKKEFNEGVFDYLSQQKDPQGQPYIPHESLAKWYSMKPDQQAGVLSLAGAKMHEDVKSASQIRILKAQEKADAAANSGVAQPLRDPQGNALEGQYYVPGARRVVDVNAKKKADDIRKLSSDLHAEAGATLAEISNAGNKRLVDTNGNPTNDPAKATHFAADIAGTVPPPGTPPELAAIMSKGKTVKLPVGRYNHYLDRYNTLTAADEPVGAASAATAAPDAANAIKQQFATGKLTREQAISELQKLGFE